MPPRIRIRPNSLPQQSNGYTCVLCRHASLATTPAPAIHTSSTSSAVSAPVIQRHPRNQPPSYKPPEFRKSQLHRQYQSLLRSSPLMVVFQHNNLKSTEWMAIRRELAIALRKVDEEVATQGRGEGVGVGEGVKVQVVQTGIFAAAMRVVEFWDPDFSNRPSAAAVATGSSSSEPAAPASPPPPTTPAQKDDDEANFSHGLSTSAYHAARKSISKKRTHGLEPLLTGPLAILTFPSVSPQHLKAALSILAPSPAFPAPKRRTNPGYHEPAVQNGLQKLMLLAARVEGRVFDVEGAKWVGGIEGGLEGLRGQLVAVLQGVGAGITGTLEAAGRSLYLAVEGRRGMLEEEAKKGGDGKGEA